ncbi:MAG: hypothetical protein IJS78_05050 [Clostridia bacterium]|nr:hypothetical protein [Clostridia bacterium]
MKLSRKRQRTVASKSKLKILFRIVFVLVAAAVITALSILLGTHLKQKAETAESVLHELTDVIPGGGGREEKTLPEGVPAKYKDPDLFVCAADLDIAAVSEEKLIDRILTLPAVYNAVSVRVTSGGSLLYRSPAIAALTHDRVPDGGDKDSVTLATVKDIVTVADRQNYRTSLIYETTSSVLAKDGDADFYTRLDACVVGELAALGPDEILIDGLIPEDGTLDFDTLSRAVKYLAALRESSGDAALGVILPASVFHDATAAAQIVTLSDYADLLAIGIAADGSDESSAYDAVSSDCYSIRGNFAAYNLRAVIRSSDKNAALGAYRALLDVDAKNVQFTTWIADPSRKSSDPAEPGGTEDEPETEGRTNENAMTKDKYENSGDEGGTSPSDGTGSESAVVWGVPGV